MRDVFTAPATLLIGNDPTNQHPLLAWQIRNNVRLHRARLYVINSQDIKLRRQATAFTQIPEGSEGKLAAFLGGDDAVADALGSTKESWTTLRDKLRTEQNLVIIFGSEIRRRMTSPAWSTSVLRLRARNSSALAITRTPAAPPTWACIPICSLAITQSSATVSSTRNGATFPKPPVSICQA